MPTTLTINAIWTINAAHGPHHDDKTALVGCHLAIVTDAAGTHYQFQNPGRTAVQTSSGANLPALPYTFPMFTSQLGGSDALNWYIKVKSTVHGVGENEAKGDWSHDPFPPGGEETDPDTWTAQAGSGSGMGDDTEDAAAASA